MSATDYWKCEEYIVSGIWKFSPRIHLDQLKEVVEQWKRRDTTNAWEELYIRSIGKDGAYGIGFRFKLNHEAVLPTDLIEACRKAETEFFYKITDQLKRRFGNDLVGWDVSRPVWTLVPVQ